MIPWLTQKTIWLYQEPLDFRKQLDGLIHIVSAQMGKVPTDGAIYVFRNRSKDKLKILVWDRNGFWMGYKRIEKGRFQFPSDQNGSITIHLEQLYCLISGLSMTPLEIGKTVGYFF